MNMGEKIKELRKKNGFTQKELAEKLNIKQQSVAYFESGKRSPSRAILDKLCDIFDVPLSYFFDISMITNINQLQAHYDLFASLTISFLSDLQNISLNENNDDLEKTKEQYNNRFYLYVKEVESFFKYYDNSTSLFIYNNTVVNSDLLNQLIIYLQKLNNNGQSEILKRIEEMTNLEKYTKFD